MQMFPATLELSLAALLISTVLGSVLGILSALKKGSIGDNVLTVAGMLGVSIPQFFFGMICILLFALKWNILPVGGRTAPGETGYLAHLRHLILPACVLGISLTAGVMRYARSSMLDTIETIFQWPGIGSAFKDAVMGQNYPLVMMIALFSVLAVLVASFLVDVMTAVLDPRVKLE